MQQWEGPGDEASVKLCVSDDWQVTVSIVHCGHFLIGVTKCTLTRIIRNYRASTVQPHLADTPEMRTSTVTRTLHAVPKVFYVY